MTNHLGYGHFFHPGFWDTSHGEDLYHQEWLEAPDEQTAYPAEKYILTISDSATFTS